MLIKDMLDDKIKRERESVRALCDELREQRDKAIHDLTESIRENDELRRQKHLAINQMKKLQYYILNYKFYFIIFHSFNLLNREQLNYYEEKFSYEKKISDEKSINGSMNNKMESNDTLISRNEDEAMFKLHYIKVLKEENQDLGIEFCENNGPLFIDSIEKSTDLGEASNIVNKNSKLSKSLNFVQLDYSSTNNRKIHANRLRRHRTSEFNQQLCVRSRNHFVISHIRSTSNLLDKLKWVFFPTNLNSKSLFNKSLIALSLELMMYC
jgi:hypothetical protein